MIFVFNLRKADKVLSKRFFCSRASRPATGQTSVSASSDSQGQACDKSSLGRSLPSTGHAPAKVLINVLVNITIHDQHVYFHIVWNNKSVKFEMLELSSGNSYVVWNM